MSPAANRDPSASLAGGILAPGGGNQQAGRLRYYGSYLRPLVGNGQRYAADTARREPSPAARLTQHMREPDLAERVVEPLVLPTEAFRRDHFLALQRWEGVVLDIDADGFSARLSDRTGEEPPQEVEFLLSDVAPSDRSLVETGAVFYWSIGYFDSAGGQRARGSTLRFRRLPVWQEAELEEARQRAKATAELLDWK